MASREVSDGTRTIERWTNEGTPGYYTGNPLTKQRDLTAAEAQALAEMDTAIAAGTNERTMRDRILAAQDANRAFLAITSPTNAQVANQVKALTRQLIGHNRLLLGDLTGTD